MQPPPFQQADYGPPKKGSNTVLWVVLGVLGLGCCGVMVIGAAIGLPVFMQARTTAQSTRCMVNTKELALDVTMYSVDNNDMTPVADAWMDSVKPYMKGLVYCPTVRNEDKQGIGYAFNKDLAGKKMTKIEDAGNAPLVFDSTLMSKNASSGLETLPSPGRHRRKSEQGNNIAYADASARFVANP